MRLKDFFLSLIKKICLSFIISLLIYFVLNSSVSYNVTINGVHLKYIHYFLICFTITFIYVIFEAIYFYLKNRNFKTDIDYYRQLPRDYSPSMVSVLMNLKLEYKKDVLADLIFLEQKKIIKIDNNQNITILDNNPNFESYETHLKMLYAQIKIMKKLTTDDITNLKLDYTNNYFKALYKRQVIEDVKGIGLLQNYGSKGRLRKILIVSLIICFLAIFTPISDILMNFPGLFMIIFLGAFFILPIMIIIYLASFFLSKYNILIGKTFIRTHEGKEDVKLWYSYYKFLKDFSRFDTKSIEEKALWGYYFAYGLALGVNKNIIKKFSLEKEKYIIK